MIFKGSRYAGTVVIQASTVAGERRALALRRIPAAPGVLEHIVMDGERLDQLAARFYGDPVKYWLLLDANADELNPLALLRPGRRIAVPSDRAGDA